ncbi:MAG TPA: hypothetical protein PLZ08_09180 [Bacillota bacterium]|nr:hypothetical protein [Bacillota bacterium]HOL10359.1 hypothetical protein [Bacillota bacterium]HPO98110.1 hypothetical protein [Bacillota bacterium]
MNNVMRKDRGAIRVIKNNYLTVEIGLPGQYYCGARFDWTGFMKQIILDDQYSFGTFESPIDGMGSGGEGFCNEFGIREPIGYQEVNQKEQFPKLGIGLLTKEDDGFYDFMRYYPVVSYETKVEWGTDQVRFIQAPLQCNGYAVNYEKQIKLDHNQVIVSYLLHNVGSKPIITSEYCHNFISINDFDINQDYLLSLPEGGLLRVETESDVLEMSESAITWRYSPDIEFYASVDRPWVGTGRGWDLYHSGSKTGVKETVDFEPISFAVWGSPFVVSPEIFINIELEPGETQHWTRIFEFYHNN